MPKSAKDISYSEQHVLERALERYGLELAPDDYHKLNEVVHRAGEGESKDNETLDGSEAVICTGTMIATLLNDEGGDEQIWGVPWANQTLVCVWSKAMGRVTTLLPEGTVVTRRKGTKVRKGKK